MPDQPTASTAPLAAGLPHVQGRCPACGTGGLFLADGGYLTCSLINCPQPDAATEVIADFWEARQHGGFSFCAQNVGHVTMTAFGKKSIEKVTAVAQRAEAVRYANEQKQRAERAETALDQVLDLATRLEEFAENALKTDDQKLYAALAQGLRARATVDETGAAATQATKPAGKDGA